MPFKNEQIIFFVFSSPEVSFLLKKGLSNIALNTCNIKQNLRIVVDRFEGSEVIIICNLSVKWEHVRRYVLHVREETDNFYTYKTKFG